MRLIAAVLLASTLGAGSAAAARLDGPSPATLNAAAQACQGQGLQPNTQVFNQCVSQATGVNVGTGGNAAGPTAGPSQQTQQQAASAAAAAAAAAHPSPTTTAAQQAAINACKGQGLAVNTPGYQDCIKQQTLSAPVATTPQLQTAFDACTAKGVGSNTTGFNQCVGSEMSKPVLNLTPAQKTDYDACAARGLVFGTSAFTSCFSTVVTSSKKSGPTPATVMAATASCMGKNVTTTTLNACITKVLGQ
jgi:hypothetical protein